MFRTRAALISSAALLGAIVSGSPGRAQMMPCQNEIAPLRAAVEKAGLTVKAAVDKKVDRSEICNHIKTFAAAEAKFVKYLETNAAFCSVPPDAIQQVKAGHSHTLKLRTQACAAGGGPGRAGPPPGPGLSEALGTSRAATPTDSKSDRGTYNTLTGNPLQR